MTISQGCWLRVSRDQAGTWLQAQRHRHSLTRGGRHFPGEMEATAGRLLPPRRFPPYRVSELVPRAATHAPSSWEAILFSAHAWMPCELGGVRTVGDERGSVSWDRQRSPHSASPAQRLPRTGHAVAPLTRGLHVRQTSRGRGTADGDPARSRPATSGPPGGDPVPGEERVEVSNISHRHGASTTPARRARSKPKGAGGAATELDLVLPRT